jgi:hypothetical protein
MDDILMHQRRNAATNPCNSRQKARKEQNWRMPDNP